MLRLRRQSKNFAFFGAAAPPGIPIIMPFTTITGPLGAELDRDRLTLLKMLREVDCDRPFETVSMTFASARFGRTPSMGAFRFCPTSTPFECVSAKLAPMLKCEFTLCEMPALARRLRTICRFGPSRYVFDGVKLPTMPGSG